MESEVVSLVRPGSVRGQAHEEVDILLSGWTTGRKSDSCVVSHLRICTYVSVVLEWNGLSEPCKPFEIEFTHAKSTALRFSENERARISMPLRSL